VFFGTFPAVVLVRVLDSLTMVLSSFVLASEFTGGDAAFSGFGLNFQIPLLLFSSRGLI
jgi:hypothetical protein